MKAPIDKINKFLKRAKIILIAIGTGILALFAFKAIKKITARVGKVKYTKKWKADKKDTTIIHIKDNEGTKQIIKLPVHPITNLQLNSDDIVQIGYPENYKKEDVLHVEIKNIDTVDRRAIANQ